MMSTSKKMLLAFVAVIVAIVYIGFTFRFRSELGWWAYTDCFALFMAAFTWLMSIVVSRIVPHSGRLLASMALVFAILFVVALVGEYIAYSILY